MNFSPEEWQTALSNAYNTGYKVGRRDGMTKVTKKTKERRCDPGEGWPSIADFHTCIICGRRWHQDNDSSPICKGKKEFEYVSEVWIDLKSPSGICGVLDKTLYKSREEAHQWKDWLDAYRKVWAYANYVNKGWKPDWSDFFQNKWFVLGYCFEDHELKVDLDEETITTQLPYFKSEDLANQAIKDLEKEYKLLFGVK